MRLILNKEQFYKIITESKKSEHFKSIEDVYSILMDSVKNDGFQQQNKGSITYQKGVEALQIALETLGFSLPIYGIDGKFGDETGRAVNKFIEKNFPEKRFTGTKSEARSAVINKMVDLMKEKNVKSSDIGSFVVNDEEKKESPKKEYTNVGNIPMGPKTKYNFDLIPDGNRSNYRSKQLPGNVLNSIIKTYGIKNLIRMNAESGGDGSDILSGAEERDICEKNGCKYYSINYHKGYQKGKGYTQSQNEINNILDKGNTLVHCAAGADRTGGAVGGFLKTKGWSPSDIWDYTIKYNNWMGKSTSSFYSGYNKYAESFMSPEEILKRKPKN
jgi:hypothetical protein